MKNNTIHKKTKVLEEALQAYGNMAAPIIETLPQKVPQLQSAMLCTLEGFNVCSLGFEEDNITRMAAVSSSLYAMSTSVVLAFSDKKASELDTISITSDLVNIFGKRIDIPDGKSLILLTAFEKGTKLGMQQYTAQYIEDELSKKTQEQND